MTIRQMMNNVSGLRDQWELLFMRGIKINDAITSEDVNSVLKGQRHLNFPPQSAYLYSNMGFHLLALIVERITGQTLPQFAKERISSPWEWSTPASAPATRRSSPASPTPTRTREMGPTTTIP